MMKVVHLDHGRLACPRWTRSEIIAMLIYTHMYVCSNTDAINLWIMSEANRITDNQPNCVHQTISNMKPLRWITNGIFIRCDLYMCSYTHIFNWIGFPKAGIFGIFRKMALTPLIQSEIYNSISWLDSLIAITARLFRNYLVEIIRNNFERYQHFEHFKILDFFQSSVHVKIGLVI